MSCADGCSIERPKVKEVIDENETIYMKDYAGRTSSDWYGDYDYIPCALEKYVTESNLWEYKVGSQSCHGYGANESVAVKTTLKNLKLMGWESDYEKYRCSEDSYNNTK